MDERVDVDEMLQEQELISEEEQQEILREIDDEFRSFLHQETIDTGYTVKSLGMRLPIIIAAAAVVAVVVSIGLARWSFSRQTEESGESPVESFYASQWQILNLYREESEQKLLEKDMEIESYREEIRTYDERIETLRNLLRLKDETESRLFIERRRLSGEGLNEIQIEEQLASMEDEARAGLPPEILDIYDLSIDEINLRIDEVLNEKQSSEQQLQESLAERDELARNAETIVEELRVNESQSYVNNEILQTVDRLNTIISGYEEWGANRSEIEGQFDLILEVAEAGDLETAISYIVDLEQVMDEQDKNPAGEQIDDFGLERRVLTLIREYLELRFPEEANTVVTEPEPVGQKDPETVIAEPTAPTAISIGFIVSAEFNQLSIRPAGSPDVNTGDEFRIVRDSGDDEPTDIGTGIVTEATAETITGRLQSLTALSNKPEPGDEVFVDSE